MEKIVLVDFRGLVLSYYSTCSEAEPLYATDDSRVTRYQTGLRAFLDHAWPKLLNLAESPNNIICVEDRGSQTRKNLCPGYKNKPDANPLLREQRSLCEQHLKSILMTFGAFFVNVPGEEADDVIAMLCTKLPGNLTVITGDKDLFQVANKRVTILRKWEVMQAFTPTGSTLRLPPRLVPFALSLLGDASDTYGGIRGFGTKALEALMSSFTPEQVSSMHRSVATEDKAILLGLRADASGTQAKILDKLLDNWDCWKLHYKLAKSYPEIGTDNINPPRWDCRLGTCEEITAAFTEAKVPYMASKYAAEYGVTRTLVTEDNLMDEITKFNFGITQAPFVAWDYETTDREKRYEKFKKGFVDARNSKITGVSFAVGYHCKHAYYFPINHVATNNLPLEIVADLIQGIDEMGKPLVAHNVAFEGLVTWSQLGFKLPSWQDTQLMAFAADENNLVGLKAVSYRYLSYKQQTYDSVVSVQTPEEDDGESSDVVDSDEDDVAVVEEEESGGDMESISGLTALNYACDDSLVTAKLRILLGYIGRIEGWYDHVVSSESLATSALTRITYSGIRIDEAEAAKQEVEDLNTVAECTQKIHALLAENIKEVSTIGLEAYLNDARDYCRVIDNRARRKGKGSSNKLGTIRDKMSQYCFYVPPGTEAVPFPFKYTVSKLNKVLELLGLPATLTGITKTKVAEYLYDVQQLPKSPEAEYFLSVWDDHVKQPKNVDESFSLLEAEARIHLKALDRERPTGTQLDLSSNDCLTGLFYVLLGFPIRCRTKVKKGTLRYQYGLSGAPATDKSAIAFALMNDCGDEPWKADVLRLLSKLQKASTRISNYWSAWKVWKSEYGFIHPYFKRFGTATHRPSSQNPNLNSIDKKGNVRRSIIPPFDGWILCSNDFSAQELRRLANQTLSPNLIAAFNGEKPINPHTLVACDIAYHALPMQTEVSAADLQLNGTTVDYGWYEMQLNVKSPTTAFLSQARGTAKVVNFGIPYGVTAPSLSEQTMLPLFVCEAAMAANAKAFPEIDTWKANTVAFAKTKGYIPTLFGMRRHCGDALSKGSRGEIARWSRQLCNSDIQGGCGAYSGAMLAGIELEDLFGWVEHKDGVSSFHRDYSKGVSYRGVLYCNLYDEVLYACHPDDYLALNDKVIEIMERPSKDDIVKQVVDCSFGVNWKDQYEVGSYPKAEKVNEVFKKLFGDKHE